MLNIKKIILKDETLKSPGPNVSTTPLRQWGLRQCLPFSWTTIRGKHCRHPIAVMVVVETFGPGGAQEESRRVDIWESCFDYVIKNSPNDLRTCDNPFWRIFLASPISIMIFTCLSNLIQSEMRNKNCEPTKDDFKLNCPGLFWQDNASLTYIVKLNSFRFGKCSSNLNVSSWLIDVFISKYSNSDFVDSIILKCNANFSVRGVFSLNVKFRFSGEK